MSPRVEILRDYCPIIGLDGVPFTAYKGEVVECAEDDAPRHLAYGHVRLVDAVDAAVPTGDEQSVDDVEGAVGMDADEPTQPDASDSSDEDAASDESDADAPEDEDSEPANATPVAAAPDESQYDERAELRAILDNAGVAYDARLGVKKLRELVEAHDAASDES